MLDFRLILNVVTGVVIGTCIYDIAMTIDTYLYDKFFQKKTK